MKNVLMKYGLPIFMLIVAVSLFGLRVYRGYTNDAALNDLRAKLVEANTEANHATADSAAVTARVVREASGLDTVRMNRDVATATDFFKKILTWNDESEYRSVRSYIVETLGEDGSKQILDTFFIDIPELIDDSGVVAVEYGSRANMSFDKMTSYVIGIHDNVYDYIASVTVTSVTNSGLLGSGECMFLYSIDENGNITQLRAYVVFEP